MITQKNVEELQESVEVYEMTSKARIEMTRQVAHRRKWFNRT